MSATGLKQRPNFAPFERSRFSGGEWPYVPLHELWKLVQPSISAYLGKDDQIITILSLLLEYNFPNDLAETERLG